MNAQVAEFLQLLSAEVPQAKSTVDEPANDSGEWWIDLHLGGRHLPIEFRMEKGFGFNLKAAGYGDRPDEVYKNSALAVRRVAQLAHENSQLLGLKQVRELFQVGQVELAQKVGVKQAAISRLESREEMKLGTLAAVIHALGGELEVSARFPEADVTLCYSKHQNSGKTKPRRKVTVPKKKLVQAA